MPIEKVLIQKGPPCQASAQVSHVLNGWRNDLGLQPTAKAMATLIDRPGVAGAVLQTASSLFR